MTSSVKANWFLTEIPEEQGDPFEVGQQQQFDALAEPILLTDVPKLNRRLTDLIIQQNRLVANGPDCALRYKADVVCSACPVKGRYGELCEGSAEIEAVTTELAIATGQSRQT